MRSLILVLGGVFCLAPAWAGAAPLDVGQTLKCRSSSPDKSLYVTIGRIETHTDGRIVVGVSLFNRAPKAALPELAHTPIEAGALSASCPTLAETPIPLSTRFEEGYQQWRSAKSRVFTISVDRIYDIVVDQVAEARRGGPGVR